VRIVRLFGGNKKPLESLYEVQQLLGHANPRTTMRYAHLSQATLQDAANVVGDLLRQAAAGR